MIIYITLCKILYMFKFSFSVLLTFYMNISSSFILTFSGFDNTYPITVKYKFYNYETSNKSFRNFLLLKLLTKLTAKMKTITIDPIIFFLSFICLSLNNMIIYITLCQIL